MNGFNDRKSIDHLYHKNGNLNDDTDSKTPQGPEEVCLTKLIDFILPCVCTLITHR